MMMPLLLTTFTLLAVAAAPAAKPASAAEAEAAARPATRPATQPAAVAAAERALDAAGKKAAAATAALERAKADAVRKLEASAPYKAALADQEEKKKALDKARAGGTPQEKLNASAAFTRARQLVEKLRAESVDKDAALKQAVAGKSAADAELVKAEKRAAAEREANDPVNVAIREGKFIKGMTETQAAEVMARFPAITSEKKLEDGPDGEKLIHWMLRDVTTYDVVRRVTLVVRNGVVESVTEKKK